MATNWGLTVDCTSASTMAAFWKEALGYTDAPPPEGFASWRDWLTACEAPEDEWDDGATIVDPDGVRPGIGFLKVPEGKTVKNRLHLDVRVAGGRHLPPEVRTPRIRTTVDRLVAAGATVLAEHTLGGHLDHVVLADPEGNEFCVV